MSLLAALIFFYICLATKEPSFFLQIMIYAFLFVAIVTFLYEVQKKLNNRRLIREKLLEDIRLAREDAAKKTNLKFALENKIERFMDLHRFSETLKDVQGVREVANHILSEVEFVFPRSEEIVLYLVHESKQGLFLTASRKKDGGVVKEKHGSVFDQWVMKRSRAVMIEDSQNDFRFAADPLPDGEVLRSVCASPLMSENKVLGVLRVSASEPLSFTSDDLRLLDIISDLGAGVLRNRLLYEKMEELAIHDSLTGLFLYRYFQERLGEEIIRTRLNKKSFGILLLDIDFFKRYNDEYGHSAGDLVLKNIASIISKNISPVDLAARYGGEEFILLLPNKSPAETFEVAERIRESVQNFKFILRRVESRVTVSIGTVTFPESGSSKEEIVGAADKKLYEAKNSGRNRVCGNI